MHGTAHLLLGSMMFAALAFGCANGDEESAGSFSATNLTYTTATTPGMTTMPPPATEPGTGEETGNDPSGPVTSSDPQTTAVDPSTTTSPDPSTTNPDPSTTNPDPSTTEPDPSTTNMTNMTNMTLTTDGTTTDDPPPMKDPQPNSGLYAECLVPRDCDPGISCLTVTDGQTMMVYDGLCTVDCLNVGDCGQAPNAPATQKCLPFQPGLSICVLECVTTNDCPTGMVCTAISTPNMTNHNLCI